MSNLSARKLHTSSHVTSFQSDFAAGSNSDVARARRQEKAALASAARRPADRIHIQPPSVGARLRHDGGGENIPKPMLLHC